MIILLDKDDFFKNAATLLQKKYNEKVVYVDELGKESMLQFPPENYERITFLGHTHPDNTFGVNKYNAKKMVELIKEIESQCPAGVTIKAVDLIGCEVGFKKLGQEKSLAQEVADELGEIPIRALAPPLEDQSKYVGTSVKIQTIGGITTYKLVGHVKENDATVIDYREKIEKLRPLIVTTYKLSENAALAVKQKIKAVKDATTPENAPLIDDLAKKYSALERLLKKGTGLELQVPYQELKNTLQAGNDPCSVVIKQLEQAIEKKNNFMRLYEKHVQNSEKMREELSQWQTVILEIKETEDLRQYLDEKPFCQFSSSAFEEKDSLQPPAGKYPPLQGQLPNGDTLFFSEESVDGNANDCAFITLGVSRSQVVTTLSPLLDIPAIRAKIAPEIQQALIPNAAERPEWQSDTLHLQAEWDALMEARIDQETKMDELKRRLCNDFPEWVREPDKSQDDQILSLKNYLRHLDPQTSATEQAISAITQQEDASATADRNIQEYCNRLEITQEYVRGFTDTQEGGKHLWLGYYSAALYAEHNDIRLYIWRKAEGSAHPNQLELVSRPENERSGRVIHMLHTGRYNHFNLLVETNALQLENSKEPSSSTHKRPLPESPLEEQDSPKKAALAKAEITGRNIADKVSASAAEGVMETANEMADLWRSNKPSPHH